MSSIKTRKKYDIEFKKRAAFLSHSSERTIQEVADNLGIHVQLLYNWRRQYTPEGEKTKLADAQDEASILRQRIAELEEENYILKKARAFFAKHQK